MLLNPGSAIMQINPYLIFVLFVLLVFALIRLTAWMATVTRGGLV